MRADENEISSSSGISSDNAPEVDSAMEIPHNSVHLEGDILSNHWRATDFLQAVTHDLHTPLNVIMGMCHLLERDPERPLTPSQQDAVDRIDRNAHALLKTVNNVIGHLRSAP
jgi:signal transduction histidine kinase